LDIGGLSLGTDQQTAGVGHHVALSPTDRLGRILTPWPPLSVVLTDWLSITPADGLGGKPHKYGRPMQIARAPSASALTTSVPRRKPLSISTGNKLQESALAGGGKVFRRHRASSV
jgi:hypothetical protein